MSIQRSMRVAVVAAIMLVSASVQADYNWDGDDGGSWNFNDGINWYSNAYPGFGWGGALHFSYNWNAGGIWYNGGWGVNVDAIFWDSTFPVSRNITGDGSGINFDSKIENDSNYAQTLGIPASGGKHGSTHIELNPVSQDLTLNSSVYNDNNYPFWVYGNNGHVLTLNAAGILVGTGTGVQLVINESSTVKVTASQTFAGDTYINAGTLQISANNALNSGFIRLGNTSGSSAANLNLDSGLSITNQLNVQSGNSGAMVMANTASSSGTATFSGSLYLDHDVTVYANSSGAVTLNGATLDLKNQTMTVDGAGASTIGGVLQQSTGSGKLTKNGTGALTITATNTFTGNITIGGGSLTLGGAGRLNSGSYGGGISNGGIYTNATSLSQTLSGIISGSGTLVQNGAGNLVLSGVNTYTGNTTINAGSLTISGSGQLNSGSYAGGILDNTSLTNATSASQTLSGAITGTGAVVQNGSSTLTLSGPNTYSGATLVLAGTLIHNGTNTSSAVTVNAGGKLMGTGSIGSLTLSGTNNPGNSAVGTLRVAGLTMNNGAVYRCEIGNCASMANVDCITNASSTFSVSGTVKVMLDDGMIAGWSSNSTTYTWVIIANGSVAASTNNLQLDQTTAWTSGKGGGLFSLAANGNNLLVNFTPVPQGVAASDGSDVNGVTITWTDGPGETGYNVYRSTSNSTSTWAQVGTTIGAGTITYSDTTATPGQLYYYWVTAVTPAGETAAGASNSGYRKLATVTGVSASDGSSTSYVTVNWSDISSETSYTVWRNTANDSSSATDLTPTGLAANTVTYNDSTATAGQQYYYWVRGSNSTSASQGDFSASDGGYVKMATVSGVSATSSDSTKVRVSWSDITGETGYTVRRHTADASGSASVIATTAANATYYDDMTATAGQQYYYWVRATNSTTLSQSDFQASGAAGMRMNLGPPILINPTATAITSSGAALGAEISDTNGAPILERGTVWGTSAAPTGNLLAEGGTTMGVFSHARTGMSAGTLYYYRGYAINSQGTNYSPDGTFYTLSAPPSLAAATIVGQTSFFANWSAATGATNYFLDVASDSGFASILPACSNVSVGNVTTYQVSSGLSAGNTYYFRLRSQNSSGTGANPGAGQSVTMEPSQASGVGVGGVSQTGFTVSWTSGNGSSRMVLVKQGAAVNAWPVDGTSYTANSTFGGGGSSQLGTGNYVVYNSSGTSVLVTGLTANTSYGVAVMEYNGSGSTLNYNTNSAPTTTQVTQDNPPVITRSPVSITVTSMVGTAPAPVTFAVTNTGGSLLSYAVTTNSPGLSVNATSGGPLAANAVQTHTVTFSVDGQGAGTLGATITVTGTGTGTNAAANRPQTIPVSMTLKNIPAVTAQTAIMDGNEMAHLSWSGSGTMMVVYKAGTASSAPDQGVVYNQGAVCGGGTVIYKGPGTSFDHIVAPGTVNNYAFYALNGNYYSIGVTASPTSGSYGSNPAEIVEPFAYTNGVALTGLAGGNGFGSSWSESSFGLFTINSGSFGNNWAGYPTNAANKVKVTPPNDTECSAGRSLANTMSNGTLYVSFLMNYQYSGPNKYCGLSLMDGVSEKAFFGEVYSADQILGISAGGSTATSSFNLNSGSGNDYLVIGKYDFSSGTLSVKAYYKGNAVPATEPSYDTTLSYGISKVTGIRIASGAPSAGAGSPGDTYFDEIRVASSWAGLLNQASSEPTSSPSNVAFTSVGGTAMTVNWAGGNGANCLVIMKVGAPVNSAPVDGTTYTANAAFGSGSQLGTGNYVVYKGSETNVSVTGLTIGQTYYVAVYAFNGSAGTENYLTTAPGSGNQQTTVPAPTVASTSIALRNLNDTAVDIGWVKGDGTSRLVVVKPASAVDFIPSSNVNYPANSNYSLASDQGSGNRVVYNSTGTNVSVTGLSPATTYYVTVYEYNSSGANYSYLTSGAPVSSLTTWAAEPATAASLSSFTDVSKTGFTVNWSGGSGASRLVLVKQGGAVDTPPSDGTAYSADSTFHNGSQVGSGNYVVYSGNGSSVTVTGLTVNTAYGVAVVEYNGSGSTANYKTDVVGAAMINTLDNVPLILRSPTSITVTSMVGTAPSAQGFTITNNGGSLLSYSLSTNAAWLSVSPAGGSGLAANAGAAHTAAFSVTGLSAGTQNGTITITSSGSGTNAASNSPQTISVSLTLTNIPGVTSQTATADGKEMVRLAWAGGGTVMVVYKAGTASSAPTQGTGYNLGDGCGGGTVVYKGAGTSLEHVVAPGTVHNYAFYTVNNDNYSAGVTTSASTGSYGANPTEIVETFSYVNGAALDLKSGGNGFSGTWTESNGGSFIVNEGSFGYFTNNPANAGNKIMVSPPVGGARTAVRSLASSVNSGRLYVSFIMNYQYQGNTKYCGLSFTDNGSEAVFFGKIGSELNLLGVSAGTDSASGYVMNPGYGEDYIVMGMYDFATQDLKVKAYYKNDTIPVTEPGVWDVTKSGVSITQINGIRLAAGCTTLETPGDTYFDEVRVATNWLGLLNMATAVPAPSLPSATASGAELVRLAWTPYGMLDVMIVAGTNGVPADPTSGHAYSVGEACGGGAVIYQGAGTSFEQVVAPGSTNTYRFFSNNGSAMYSTGLTSVATMLSYGASERVDPFAYTNGATLNGRNGGHGWVGVWTESDSGSYTVSEGSFGDVPGYSANYGNKILVSPPAVANRFAYRSFPTINTGKVFVSFIMNYASEGGGKFAGVSLMNGATEKAFFGKVSGDNNALGLSDGVTDTVSTNFVLHGGSGNDYVVVGVYDFSARVLKVKGYWKTDTLPMTEPVTWDAVMSASSDQITGIRVGAGATSDTPGDTYFDEIRVATNWVDVVNTPAPAAQAGNIAFPVVQSQWMTISWTRGNGAACIVVVSEGSPVSGVADEVNYTANSVFGSGSAAGNGYVVYKGTGTSVTVTGLKTSTLYHVRVYEFNGANDAVRLDTASATGNPVSQMTGMSGMVLLFR